MFFKKKKQKRKDVLAQMTVHELAEEIRHRSEVIAVQIWQEADIIAAIEEDGSMPATPELICEVANAASPGLENCEHGWDVINSALSYAQRH